MGLIISTPEKTYVRADRVPFITAGVLIKEVLAQFLREVAVDQPGMKWDGEIDTEWDS